MTNQISIEAIITDNRQLITDKRKLIKLTNNGR